ncbi:hypothetical protein [Celeribacter baekdonensis]|uniref:hypothetical protein n=1 Tax=Celeribacter baekdonensis TaxID=875171 RepID=UPI003A9129FE
MNISTFTGLSLIVFSLAACGTAGGDADSNSSGTSQSDYETYNAAHDAITDKDLVATASALGTAAANARSDTVEMSGIYGIQSDALLGTDAILGEMSMTANFGNDTVSGAMTNNFIAFDGANGAHSEGSVEPLSGSMAYSGTISGNTAVSHFDGILTRTDGTQYDLYVDMEGTFYTVTGGVLSELGAIGNFEGNITVIGDATGTIYDLTDGYDFDSRSGNETGFVVCESLCSGE